MQADWLFWGFVLGFVTGARLCPAADKLYRKWRKRNMAIKTYPEMNETIKNLLRRSEKPMNLYILARIEELEAQLTPAPHTPLTLEELKGMDGEPVWVECHEMEMAHLSGWGIRNDGFVEGYHTNYCDEDYGKAWLAYRRKPDVAEKPTRITRFDRIRACATPVDMALELDKNRRRFCLMAYGRKYPNCETPCVKCIIDWLNESET